MIFSDSLGLGDKIAAQLKANKQAVIVVAPGSGYKPVKGGGIQFVRRFAKIMMRWLAIVSRAEMRPGRFSTYGPW
jgi:hypothetical protein